MSGEEPRVPLPHTPAADRVEADAARTREQLAELDERKATRLERLEAHHSHELRLSDAELEALRQEDAADETRRHVLQADLEALAKAAEVADRQDAALALDQVEARARDLTDTLERAIEPLRGVLAKLPTKRLDEAIGAVVEAVGSEGREASELRFVATWLGEDAQRQPTLPTLPRLDRAAGEQLVALGKRLVALSEALERLDVHVGRRRGSGLFERCETILSELDREEEKA